MKNLLLPISIIAGMFLCQAQTVSSYTFSSSTGTYTPLFYGSAGVVIGTASGDDDVQNGIPLGFTFNFGGVDYTYFSITPNGFIKLGSSTSNAISTGIPNFTNALSATAANRPLIAPLWDDNNATGDTILYRISGANPSRQLTVQWKNLHIGGAGSPSSPAGNFQVVLNQTSNVIQFRYGTIADLSGTSVSASIGLNDSNSFLSVTPGIPPSISNSFANNSISAATYLTNGLVYTFTQSTCIPPATLSFTSTAIPNATINWGAVPGAASYEYAIDTTATPPVSGTSSTGTTASVSGLPTGNVIYAHVRTNCGSGTFSNWITRTYIPCATNITPGAGATNVAVPVTFNWTPVSGISSYQILLSTDNGATYPLSSVVGVPPASDITGLSYNTTYKWFVRGIAGMDTAAAGCATANATLFSTPVEPNIPSNNMCSAAVILLPNSVVNGTNVGATQSILPSLCASSTSSSANDVWYSVTALSNGTAIIKSTNASADFDAVLVGYSGSCGTLTNIGCADETGQEEDETLSLTGLVAGQTYLIRVYGYNGGTGIFTLTATGPALPVTGLVLSAIRNGKKVQLGWKTFTEINNTGFDVQRAADGTSFAAFQHVATKATGGNSAATLNYNADDVKPFVGANYYRLKQTDKDGKGSYSNVVYVKGVAVSNLTLSAVYPNPTREVLKAAIQAPAAESITFVITDMACKIIKRHIAAVTTGDNTINLNVADLPSGNYLLKATCNNGCESAYQKFTKL